MIIIMPKKDKKPKRTRVKKEKAPVFKVVKPSVVSHRQPSQSLSSEERIVSLMNKQAADNLRQQQTLLGSLVSSIGALIPSTAKATASTMPIPKPETGHVRTNEELLKMAKGYKEAESKYRHVKKKEEEYVAKHGEKPKYTPSGNIILMEGKSGKATVVEDPFASYQPTPIQSPAQKRPPSFDELRKQFGGGGGYNSSSEEELVIKQKKAPITTPKPTTTTDIIPPSEKIKKPIQRISKVRIDDENI